MFSTNWQDHFPPFAFQKQLHCETPGNFCCPNNREQEFFVGISITHGPG
jgi:hypothetical protein